MHDARIRLKMKETPKKFHAPGSLTRRVILVCLALLVIPLFLHSLYLYRTEYKEKLNDVQLSLQLIGEAQNALLEERVKLQWNRLDAIDSVNNPIAKKLGVESIGLPSGMSGNFVFADRGFGGLVVGKQITKDKAFILITPFDDLIRSMSHVQNNHYPVSIAIQEVKGATLAGVVKPDALSVRIPVANSNFYLLLTVPESAIQDLHYQQYLYRILTLLFFSGVVGGGLVALLIRRIASPLKKLCNAMDRVTEGAVHVRYEPDKMGFEINELGKQFNNTLDALLLNQALAEKERLAREKMAQELKIGREIQLSLLPKRLPDWKDLDIGPGFMPAAEVGGDFYDLFSLDDNKLFMIVADTEGKGIPACLYALGFRSLLRSAALKTGSLSEILLEANHLFWLDAQQSGTFITAWVGIYDREKRILTYCSMGHPPAVLKRNGELRELGTQGIAFGATECEAIQTSQIKLEKDDLIFICTDGILEAHNSLSERFGQKRLNHFLTQINSNSSSEKIVELLFEVIQKFSIGMLQHDDITCLSIRVL